MRDRSALDNYNPRARRLMRDHYLPGRPALAEQLAGLIVSEVVRRGDKIEGRATLIDNARALYSIAGRRDRVAGCTMLLDVILGLDFGEVSL